VSTERGQVHGAAAAALAKVTADVSIHDNLTAILIIAITLAAAIAATTRVLVDGLLRKRDVWASKGQHPIWRTFVAVASLWPVLLIVPPLVLVGSNDSQLENVARLAVLILLLEVGALLVGLALFASSPLLSAWRYSPRWLTPVATVAVAGGTVFGWFAADWIGFSDVPKRSAAAIVMGVGVAFVAVGVVLMTSNSPVGLQTISAALRKRDGVDGKAPRGRDLFRTMAVAAVPGISELAEATQPPFHKSFMIVEPRHNGRRTTAIVFEVFGVDDERPPEVAGHPALPVPPNPGHPSRGSYLVDRITLELT